MGKHRCQNSNVKIVKVSEDEIDAVCDMCGKTGHAERKDYFEFEWRTLLKDTTTKHDTVQLAN